MAANTAKRRAGLDLRSGEEVIQEITHLRQAGYLRTKSWNLTQICQHLEKTMRGGMEGFGFRLPWILRVTMMKWGFAWLLKRRRLPAGLLSPKMLEPDHADCESDDHDAIDSCIAMIRRSSEFLGPIEDYPFLNDLDFFR
ncbi:MAG: DUF1569 domain-containing protein [Planctomycetota bacterium]